MAPNRSALSGSFAPAAAGTRVRVITMIAFGVGVLVTAIVAIVFGIEPDIPAAPMVLGVASGLALMFVVWLCARIRDYRLVDGVLHVVRPLYAAKIPLAGLVAVQADRTALAGARKVIGNDGMGAIAGRFRSKKLGAFRAYVSDPDRAVILRWPDRCVVVSPEKPALFVSAMQAFCAGKGAS